MIVEMESRLAWAKIQGPQDLFTRLALFLNMLFGIARIVLVPVQIVTTTVSGLAIALTFGLLLLPLTVIWWVMIYPLLGSSFLWIKVPFLRPFLVPCIIVAFIGATFVQLVSNPDGPTDRHTKIVLCEAWPLTWLVFRPL